MTWPRLIKNFMTKESQNVVLSDENRTEVSQPIKFDTIRKEVDAINSRPNRMTVQGYVIVTTVSEVHYIQGKSLVMV